MLDLEEGSSLPRSVFRLFFGMLMMEEVVLWASIHDSTSWISSSSPTSILDFSKASSRLMMLLPLDYASMVEGAVMVAEGMSYLAGVSWCNSGLISLKLSTGFPRSYSTTGLVDLLFGSSFDIQPPISTLNKNKNVLNIIHFRSNMAIVMLEWRLLLHKALIDLILSM